jgi:hypothetical protein
MCKPLVLLFLISFPSLLEAQSVIDNLLLEIGQHNKTIVAAEKYLEAKSLEFQTGNNLDNPFISADYLIGKPVLISKPYKVLIFLQHISTREIYQI